ncbi:MAG: tetratricopeptide repeat protein [Candidatus Obscuribacterales bacterium]
MIMLRLALTFFLFLSLSQGAPPALASDRAALERRIKSDLALLRKSSADPDLHLDLAEAYFEKGQFALSMKEYDRAVSLAPGAMRYHLARGDALEQLDRYDDAYRDYRAVLAIRPKTGRDLYMRAQTLEQLGRYEESLSAAQAALKGGYRNFKVLRLRGKCFYRLDRYDEAIAALDQSLKLKQNSTTYRYLGLCQRAMGRLDKAVSIFSEAARRYPEDGVLQLETAVALMMADRVKEAKSYYLVFEKTDRTEQFADWREFSLFCEAQKKLDDYSKIIALKGASDAAPVYERAVLYMELGQYQRAGDEMKRYLEQSGYKGKAGITGAIIAELGLRLSGRRFDAEQVARQAREKLSVRSWPYPILEFVAGTLSREKLLNLASDNTRKAQAGYYIAMIDLLNRHESQAIAGLKKVMASGARGIDEFSLARAELERLERRARLRERSS